MEYKVLEKGGLTKNESKIYLALLEIGQAKSGDILKKAGINSGKIYEILEKLKSKGLVCESKINKIKYFTASEPNELEEYAKKQREYAQEQERKIKEIIPQLKELKSTRKLQTKTTTYFGYKGLKTIVKDILSKLKITDEIRAMGITEHKNKIYTSFWSLMNAKTAKNGIRSKYLFSDKEIFFNKTRKLKNCSVRLLTIVIPTTISIFGKDKVLIMNYEEPSSFILIEDEKIAQSFICFFEQLWKIAKK